MKDTIIDVRGEVCPKPLILTKKALNDNSITENFIVLIDNETSRHNVERFLADNNIAFDTQVKEGTATITVSKKGAVTISADVEAYCDITGNKARGAGNVICIRSNRMGVGPDDLGELLIEGFINTIKEVEPLPKAVILYNSGVQLAVDGSPVVESLKELEEAGVTLLCCGTCADFLKVKEEISVGTISNMYTILETLTEAGKVIYP